MESLAWIFWLYLFCMFMFLSVLLALLRLVDVNIYLYDTFVYYQGPGSTVVTILSKPGC